MSTQAAARTEAVQAAADLRPLIDAIDAIDQGHAWFSDLGGLFAAIRELAAEDSTLRTLANVGQYLACDWVNTQDLVSEDLTQRLAALRGKDPAALSPDSGNRPL
jgi:hypothetical protein